MHTSTYPRKSRRCLLALLLATLLIVGAAPARTSWSASYQPNEVSSQQTVGIYQNIPGLTTQQIEYGRTAIPRLHYNGQRILRKICTLPGVNFESAKQVMELLSQERFTFEQV